MVLEFNSSTNFVYSLRGRCDSYESHLPLIWTIYFPTAPFQFNIKGLVYI